MFKRAYRYMPGGILDTGEVVSAIEDGIPLRDIVEETGKTRESIETALKEEHFYYKQEAINAVEREDWESAMSYIRGIRAIESLGIMP